jgi:GWxTD domain-containing protein
VTRHSFALVLAVAASLTACGGGNTPRPQTGTGGPAGAPASVPQNLTFDAVPLYRQAGMLARGLPMPFVGRVAFLASPSPDRTHALIALSLANNALSFTRESDERFRASYTVAISVRRGAEVVVRADATEEVVVGAFRETARTDETLVFQQILDVEPGDYDLVVVVRDEGSQRNAQEQMALRVPRLADGAVTAPLPVLQVTPRASRDSLPVMIASPRATAVFGRDSVLPVYVESYEGSGAPVRLELRNERGRVLWSNAVEMPSRGAMSSRVIDVPVSRIGIGIAELAVAREGGPSSLATRVFVGFGDDLPVATFGNMLTYLRYFAKSYRLDALRAAPEEDRPAEWAKFVRETDSQVNTPAHEDLRDYFSRLVRANSRFRDESTVGWLSDRGRVYISLGEPDQVLEPQIQDFQRTRQQVWEYRSLNAQLVFYDQTGTGRWRLTQSSATRFEAEFQRRLK